MKATKRWPDAPTAGSWVHIGPAQTILAGNLDEARSQFQQYRAVHLASVFEPVFFRKILSMCDASHFGPETTNAGFREIEQEPQRTGRVMNVVLSRPELLRWLEEVTGCGPLVDFAGALARTLVRPGDQLLWHDDLIDGQDRRLALVIDLSTQPYLGGEFQLRTAAGDPLCAHKYERLGSALIFEVSRRLEHRVLPLTAGGPRRVFAGWARARAPQA